MSGMTVRDLIAELAKHDGDLPVVLAADILGQYERVATVTYDPESYYEAYNGLPVVVLGLD